MGRYDLRDLVRIPGLLSLSRVPLAVVFSFVVGRPVLALGVLVGAGLTDVLDGWYARRFGQVTATGAALDPITDKLFVLTVAITLVVTGQLSVGIRASPEHARDRRAAARALGRPQPRRASGEDRAALGQRCGKGRDGAAVRVRGVRALSRPPRGPVGGHHGRRRSRCGVDVLEASPPRSALE